MFSNAPSLPPSTHTAACRTHQRFITFMINAYGSVISQLTGVSTRSVFNMSGRRRLSFETDGKWEGPMSLYLVVIGVGIDRAGVLAALEGMRVEAPSASVSA